jgi:hypothetical protein
MDLPNIPGDGLLSLSLNGWSKHLDDVIQFNAQTKKNEAVKFNEVNMGAGLNYEWGEDSNRKYITGGYYDNSYGEPSYYAGGGIKKRFGKDYYTDVGLLGGVVTGYDKKFTPMVLPTLTFGQKDKGAVNFTYAPKTEKNPRTLMMNLEVPFK